MTQGSRERSRYVPKRANEGRASASPPRKAPPNDVLLGSFPNGYRTCWRGESPQEMAVAQRSNAALEWRLEESWKEASGARWTAEAVVTADRLTPLFPLIGRGRGV
jgi:hypothetical protein